jgi:hypothetical protein
MNLDDRKLEHWLRDVDVPDSLIDQLLVLPDDGATRTSQRVRAVAWTTAILALAASLAGIVLLVRRSGGGERMEIAGRPQSDPTVASDRVIGEPADSANRASRWLAEWRADLRQVDRALRAERLRELSEQLDSLGSKPWFEPLAIEQRTSLVASLSALSALERGADRAWVRNEMLRVIESYPRTRGAEIAERFVANYESP